MYMDKQIQNNPQCISFTKFVPKNIKCKNKIFCSWSANFFHVSEKDLHSSNDLDLFSGWNKRESRPGYLLPCLRKTAFLSLFRRQGKLTETVTVLT